MFPSNLHTHTNFSDGTHSPEEYINKAIASGLKTYGFSDHAPISFKEFSWCIKPGKTIEYCSEINRLKQLYTDKINILLGFEVDYIPGEACASDFKKYNPDFLIGSIHFLKTHNSSEIMEIDGSFNHFITGFKNLFNNNAKMLVEYYFATIADMVNAGGFDIVGHCDKIKMFLNRCIPELESLGWYRELETESALMLAKSGLVTEINTRSFYKKHGDEPYPSWRMIKTISEAGGKLTLSADTHDPEGVNAFFDSTIECLNTIGVKTLLSHNGNEWVEYALRIK